MLGGPYKLTRLLLLFNFVFWLVISSMFTWNYRHYGIGHEVVGIMMFLTWADTFCYLIFLIGIQLRIRMAENLLYVFLGVNMLLGLTDEFEFADLLSLFLNLTALIIFIVQHHRLRLHHHLHVKKQS